MKSKLQILGIILNNKIKPENTLVIKENETLHYQNISGMVCFDRWWCYEVVEETLKLSELTPQKQKVRYNDYYYKIEAQILKDGFNYDKGSIIVTSENLIFDGHHRYHLLLKNYGPEHEVKVKRVLNIHNTYKHVAFILLCVKPLVFIYKIITLQFLRK